ncbi:MULTISPECIES: hypothetical protein [Dietzia]|uniref:hypothetical protein n=1 Tax=Dietzia sp. KRD202 TaxID=2729732 RepID=UPI0019CFDDA8|nr:hypothetical protein [Dietzia sp. KRD202]
MYTLLFTLLIVSLSAFLFRITDRGIRERQAIRLSRSLQGELTEALCRAEIAGIGLRDIEYARKRASRMLWVRLAAPAAFFTMVAIVCHGFFGLSETTSAAIVTALLTYQIIGTQYMFGDLVLRLAGHLDHAAGLPRREVPFRILGLLLFSLFSFVGVWLIITSTTTFSTDGLASAAAVTQVLAGVVLLASSASPMKYIHRLLVARRTTPRFSKSTTAEEILLLRAFDDDHKRVQTTYADRGAIGILTGGSRMRFEELIAAIVQTEGNFVAIGRPDERLPPLGAARTYWDDDEWQLAVEHTAASAKLIVLVAGTTEGLRWEIQKLKEWGFLEKCLFLVPPGRASETIDRVERLCDELQIPTSALDSFPVVELLGFCITARGRLVAYTANGRDDVSYFGAVVSFLGTLSGEITVLPHGALSRHLGHHVSEEPQ